MGTIITMWGARRAWWKLETRLAKALAELNHNYLALLATAEAFGVDGSRGLLQTAANLLQHPLEAQIQKPRQRLKDAFSSLGGGFFRRAPGAVRLDIMKFTGGVDEIYQHCRRLSGRLRLAKKIIDVLRQHPGWRQPNVLRQALSYPEAVWLSLVLRQRRRLSQQLNEHTSALSWQARIEICRRWLELLETSLATRTSQKWRQSLGDLAEQLAGQWDDRSPEAAATRDRLDYLLSEANREASDLIASSQDHFRQPRNPS